MNSLRRAAACLTLAAAVLLAGCTTEGPRRVVDENGWETSTTYTCDWKSNGAYLRPGCTVNSPILPFTRGNCVASTPMTILLMVPFALDIVASPLAYYFDRDCRVRSTENRFVGTPASKRREKEEAARREREAEAARREQERANSAAELARKAELAKQQAEAERVAAAYPPLSDSPRPAAARPDDFALVVGIEGYRSIPKADYGEGDAKLVKSYVESLGVPPGNVVLLTGEHASRSDVTKYLEEWLPGVVKADSRVYFYYSGHGAPDPATGDAYLVPWDGDPQFLKSTALPLAKIYADLAALPSKEAVVMLDSCFSGAGGRSVLAPGARPLVTVKETEAVPAKTAVLAAAGSNEIAGGLDLRKHGLFTYFLLRGLGGEADADKDGHVTLGELQEYLKSKVGEAARRFSNRDQTPRLLGDAALRMY